MRVDIIDLRDFYAGPLGRVVRRVIDRQLRSLWTDVRGLDIAGLGYAGPFLDMFRGEATRVVNMMPAGQGVSRWPVDEGNLTTLVDETQWPLSDASIDRLLMVHCLETTDALQPVLRQAWRALSPIGRLLIIIPNRRGLWSRVDRTPFGFGRPFSRGQLTELMRDAQFTPTQWSEALFMPPFGLKMMMRSWGAWENVGQRMWPGFSGLLLLEASKQIYTVSAERKRSRVLRPLPVPAPAVGASRTATVRREDDE